MKEGRETSGRWGKERAAGGAPRGREGGGRKGEVPTGGAHLAVRVREDGGGMGRRRDWAVWALREKKEGEEKVGWAEIERRKKFSFFNSNLFEQN